MTRSHPIRKFNGDRLPYYIYIYIMQNISANNIPGPGQGAGIYYTVIAIGF